MNCRRCTYSGAYHKGNTIPFLKTLFEDSGKCATNLFYPIKSSNVFYTIHAPLLTKEITL